MRPPHTSPRILLIAALALAGAGAALAQNATQPPPTPTKEQRVQMAAMHEQMAACLRSETPFADCRTQMHDGCMKAMGAQGCMMMGCPGMGRGMGMGGPGGMMGQPPARNPGKQ